VAFLSIGASVRRLWFAANPTALHPDEVVAALGPSPDRAAIARLREVVRGEPAADWERDLFEALDAPNENARVALVNEQLTELDIRMQRWARVPRVCASVASSFGILLGAMLLRRGLADSADLPVELYEMFVRDLLFDALGIVGFGLAGTMFSIVVHAHAKRMARERLAATDKMIEKLEAAAARPSA
jgi:hypothetical protein